LRTMLPNIKKRNNPMIITRRGRKIARVARKRSPRAKMMAATMLLHGR
jgi:hypothetical protein